MPVPADERPKRWRWAWIAAGVVVLSLAVASVPVVGTLRILAHWSAKERSPAVEIPIILRDAFDVSLPSEARVVHQSRLPAGIDSAGAYELTMPPGVAASFVAELSAAAGRQHWTKTDDAGEPFLANRPAWWDPQAAGVSKWIGLSHPDRGAYRIGVSTSGRCFIHWMTV